MYEGYGRTDGRVHMRTMNLCNAQLTMNMKRRKEVDIALAAADRGGKKRALLSSDFTHSVPVVNRPQQLRFLFLCSLAE